MSNSGRYIRAFRPSRFARLDDFDDESERIKEANLQMYAERAQAGVPLFDSAPVAVQSLTLRVR
jgi:hypothetical protein